MTEITASSLIETVANNDSSAVLQLSSILLQCFALIVTGFAAGRFDVINVIESEGLTNFVSYFSLPALIFLSLARCDFSQIDWYFVVSVCIAKLLIFFLVVSITLVITNPSSIGKAGIFGIFVTQSNDFAVGYPIFISLYQKDHPNYPDYLYVVAPLQLVLINPCGIFMMELQKYRSQAHSSPARSSFRIIVQVTKRTFLNPIIVMTLGGVLWNLIYGPVVPVIIKGFLQSLSDAFAPASLFLLGLNIVQESGNMKNFSRFLVPCTLSGVKLIIFPILLKTICQYLIQGDENHISSLSNFGFLYGTIPTAPTAVIFAIYYNLSSWVMSSGLIISTIISAPLMFVSASLIRFPDSTPESFHLDLQQSIKVISLISIPCGLWTLFIFLCGRKWTIITHRITFMLIFTQTALAIAGYAITLEMKEPKLCHLIPIFASFTSRFLATIISITLSMIHHRSLSQIMKIQRVCLIMTAAMCFIFTSLVYFLATESPMDSRDYEFPFGVYQAVVSLVVLMANIVVNFVGIIMQQRYYASFELSQQTTRTPESEGSSIVSAHNSDDERNDQTDSLRQLVSSTDDLNDLGAEQNGTAMKVRDDTFKRVRAESGRSDSPVLINETHHDDIDRRTTFCRNSLRCYWSDLRRVCSAFDENMRTVSFYNYVQVNLHMALLLLSELSMIVGFVVSLSKAMGERVSGIYKELIFLDIFLSHGQAIASFVLFGLDFTPLIDLWRCFTSKYNSINSLDGILGDSMDETIHLSQQFHTYHREKCSADICFLITYKSSEILAFKGRDLVKWLIESGLTYDRKSAQVYAMHLFKGRIFKHLDGCSHFLNTSSLYHFVEDWSPPANR